MFSQNEYLLAWTVYLSGALLCFYCWWVITAKVPVSLLKLLLRVMIGIVLFTPWYTEGTAGFLAPAVVAMSIEGLFVSGASFARAGMPLLVAIIVACLLASIVATGYFICKRAK